VTERALRGAVARLCNGWSPGGTVARRLAVDRRSLAAFRVALAVVLLVDLAGRARNLTAFYTDGGVLPRSVLATLAPGYAAVSLHALSGSLAVQAVLFAVAVAAALAVLVGYRSRLAVGLSLALLVSLQLRNPFVLNSGDVLLRRLLFWGLFLPLGSRWAVDAPVDPAEGGVVGPATAGLLAQAVAVYVTNAAVKLRSDVWLRGDAVRYAFQLDHFTVGLGNVVAGWTPALTAAAWLWLALLVSAPLLVVLTGRRRTALVGAFAVAHLGMALTLQLAVFPLVSLAALVPFLPGTVWEVVERRVATVDSLSGRLPTRRRLVDRYPALSGVARGLAAACLVVLLLTNAVGLGVVDAPSGTPDQLTDRTWDMFAPSPPRATWWVVAPATLANGERVNAITGARFEPGRPAEVADRHRNARWRKFLADARTDPRLRASLAASLCARWNRSHETAMTAVELRLLAEPTDLDGPESVERETLGTYRC